MTLKEVVKIKEKIEKGLELSFDKLLAEKKAKNSELVVMQDGKIVEVKPY